MDGSLSTSGTSRAFFSATRAADRRGERPHRRSVVRRLFEEGTDADARLGRRVPQDDIHAAVGMGGEFVHIVAAQDADIAADDRTLAVLAHEGVAPAALEHLRHVLAVLVRLGARVRELAASFGEQVVIEPGISVERRVDGERCFDGPGVDGGDGLGVLRTGAPGRGQNAGCCDHYPEHGYSVVSWPWPRASRCVVIGAARAGGEGSDRVRIVAGHRREHRPSTLKLAAGREPGGGCSGRCVARGLSRWRPGRPHSPLSLR
jgi:hypothetical protein